MLLSKGTSLVLGLSILLLGLSGCAQTPTISQTDREAYLQQFIGQSSQYIDRNLDLKRLGYQQISEPELVERPVTVPLPIAQFPTAGTGTVPVPVTVSPASGYDVNLQCKITFLLKDNIATSVSLSGRTC